MLVSTLFDRINSALRGLDDEAPTEGSSEATYWLDIINRKKDEWATDPFENWSSLFQINNVTGTISAGDQTYTLPSGLLRPSDVVKVTNGGQEFTFQVIEPQLRDEYTDAVYLAGSDLVFVDEIAADSQLVGGTISVPGFYMPDDLTAFTDTVPVDDPNWLALAVAGEIAFSDVTYEDKYSDLMGMANNLYTRMKANNRKGTIVSPRAAQTKVRRIGQVER
jgi:hypothetical protein